MSQHIHLDTYSTLPQTETDKRVIAHEVEKLISQLTRIQSKLYAQHEYAVLIILQGIDTSGKDNTVRSVFTGINPAGCNVVSFKVPTAIELDHHFLWRISMLVLLKE